MKPHFLQTSAWEKFNNDLGNTTVRLTAHEGEVSVGEPLGKLGIIERGRLGKRLYFPYVNQFSEPELKEAVEFCRQYQLDFLRADFVDRSPFDIVDGQNGQADAIRGGSQWCRALSNSQPENTAVAKVAGDWDEVLRKVSKSQRKMYRHGVEKGVKFTESKNPEDVEILLEHLKSVADRTGMVPHSDEYFRKLAASLFPIGAAGLLFAELDGRRIASKLYFKDEDTLYCMHSGSFSEFREMSITAVLNVWTLYFANTSSLKFVDFFGVAPSDDELNGMDKKLQEYYASWAGFTRFKFSFAASRVKYFGTWELPVNAVKYKLYTKLRKVMD